MGCRRGRRRLHHGLAMKERMKDGLVGGEEKGGLDQKDVKVQVERGREKEPLAKPFWGGDPTIFQLSALGALLDMFDSLREGGKEGAKGWKRGEQPQRRKKKKKKK